MRYLALVGLGLLLGCTAHAPAQSGSAQPAAAANKPNCSKIGCSAHEDTPWGYCQWQTQQTGKTFMAWLEIGIRKEQADVSTAHCTLQFPSGGGSIATLTGNVDYRPMGHAMSSMVARIGTCCGPEEYLWAGKLTAVPPASNAVPLYATFPHPLPASGLTVWFYDDLAKPTSINVGVAGTFQ